MKPLTPKQATAQKAAEELARKVANAEKVETRRRIAEFEEAKAFEVLTQ